MLYSVISVPYLLRIGVEYIGFSISACGIGSIIGAYGGGFLTKFMPRWILIVVTLGIEMACGIFLLKWEPSEVSIL